MRLARDGGTDTEHAAVQRVSPAVGGGAGDDPDARRWRVGPRGALRDEITPYVQQFTGDLDNAGIVVPEKILQYESDGWYQLLYDETSAGMDKGKDTVDTGLNYNNEFRESGHERDQLYSSSLRRCGPNLERSQLRELGCTSDLPAGSPYGSQGSPGFGPQPWAYRGASLGPPDEPVADEGLRLQAELRRKPRHGIRVLRPASARRRPEPRTRRTIPITCSSLSPASACLPRSGATAWSRTTRSQVRQRAAAMATWGLRRGRSTRTGRWSARACQTLR